MRSQSANSTHLAYQPYVGVGAVVPNFYLDCCVLAYQIFAQSTFWKIDPFTETLQNNTYRRELFEHLKSKERTGESLGPAHLDPLYQYYEYVDPRVGVFYRGALNAYGYFAPPAWVSAIQQVFLCYRRNATEASIHYNPEQYVIMPQCQYKNAHGDNDLYCFEGESGYNFKKSTRGMRSLFGFVLHDKRSQRLVITFRGSRSGNAVRGMVSGFFRGSGNADWVSDMNSLSSCVDPDISPTAGSAVGMSYVLKSCWTSLLTILTFIYKGDGPIIQEVVIAGHSLGGGLAGLLKIALQLGEYGDLVERTTGSPLFRHAKAYIYGAPPFGDGRMQMQLWQSGSVDQIRHYYIGKDIITWAPTLRGQLKSMGTSDVMAARPKLTVSAAHGLEEIRAHLLGAHVQSLQAMAATQGEVLDLEDQQLFTRAQQLWITAPSLDALSQKMDDAKTAYARAFNMEYWAFLWDELQAVYLEKHHHYKSSRGNIFSRDFFRSSRDNVENYRAQCQQAKQYFMDKWTVLEWGHTEIWASSSSINKGLQSQWGCTDGIVVLGFICALVETLCVRLRPKNVPLDKNKEGISAHHVMAMSIQFATLTDRVDFCNTVFYGVNNLITYLSRASEGATLVKYAVHHFSDILVATMPDLASVQQLLARVRRLPAEGFGQKAEQ
ncbi:MAG: hypothetical protein A3J38_02975 [Gammaproteobacteria bacterium RIFCSPHIGHO2_12_FULL_45_9]|nr:MAG: hypothetical protein A3J38_02975 [Gammaproteobacteria bacterium RIFCSPHIGHO2_12_FULL_45_9]